MTLLWPIKQWRGSSRFAMILVRLISTRNFGLFIRTTSKFNSNEDLWDFIWFWAIWKYESFWINDRWPKSSRSKSFFFDGPGNELVHDHIFWTKYCTFYWYFYSIDSNQISKNTLLNIKNRFEYSVLYKSVENQD